MEKTLEELYELAIRNVDYRRACEIKRQIEERDAKEKQETEERKQLADAIKVLDMFGITGVQYAEILEDLHKGADE